MTNMNSDIDTLADDLPPLLERLARQLDVRSELTSELLTQIGNHTGLPVSLTDAEIATVAAQYRRLGSDHPRRHELLRLLAASGSRAALDVWLGFMLDDPPQGDDAATMALVPLFQQENWPIDAVFPRLLDALDQSAVAAVVIDLANFLTRKGRVARHPAAEQVTRLAELLGSVVGVLGQIEEHPERFATTPQELTAKVASALPLVVSLCDALGLIGEPAVIGKLNQARELRHRRIRVEANAALARLGDKSGLENLAELAAEPVVRTRVLAYLAELNELPKAKHEFVSLSAQAVGRLAAWLAEPVRYGVGPASIEVIDHRRQHWPGFEQAIDCFLIRYQMPLAAPTAQGIALAGPSLAAANVDLADLHPAAIYAYYAGLTVEHEAIVETPAERLALPQLEAWTAQKAKLQQAQFSDLKLLWKGDFFEHHYWVALGQREGQRVVIVSGDENVAWYPHHDSPRALSPADWYTLHKGRVLLETFNPPESTSS